MGRKIPARIYDKRDRPPSGFLEIDLVSHCGRPLVGSFIHSLGGPPTLQRLDRSGSHSSQGNSFLVVEGLEAIGRQLPLSHNGHRLGQRTVPSSTRR